MFLHFDEAAAQFGERFVVHQTDARPEHREHRGRRRVHRAVVRTSGLGGFQLHTDCRETARQLESCVRSIVHRPSQLRLPVSFHECLAVCAARRVPDARWLAYPFTWGLSPERNRPAGLRPHLKGPPDGIERVVVLPFAAAGERQCELASVFTPPFRNEREKEYIVIPFECAPRSGFPEGIFD